MRYLPFFGAESTIALVSNRSIQSRSGLHQVTSHPLYRYYYCCCCLLQYHPISITQIALKGKPNECWTLSRIVLIY